jgi:regulator of sirC expression with transglutaminase-like and TPR domain
MQTRRAAILFHASFAAKAIIALSLAAPLAGCRHGPVSAFDTQAREAVVAREWSRVREIAVRWHQSDPDSPVPPWLVNEADAALGNAPSAHTLGGVSFGQVLDPTAPEVLAWTAALTEEHPESSPAWTIRAYAAFKAHDDTRGLDFAERAVAADPSDAGAHTALGSAHAWLSDHTAAIAEYTRALELDPRSVYAHIYRAGAYLNLGDPHRALADCDAALRLSPSLYDALVERRVALCAARRYDEAWRTASAAIAVDPARSEAYIGRAAASLHLGQYQSVIEDATRAISIYPRNTRPYLYRGLAYEHSSWAAARRDFEVVIQHATDDSQRKRARRELDALNARTATGAR